VEVRGLWPESVADCILTGRVFSSFVLEIRDCIRSFCGILFPSMQALACLCSFENSTLVKSVTFDGSCFDIFYNYAEHIRKYNRTIIQTLIVLARTLALSNGLLIKYGTSKGISSSPKDIPSRTTQHHPCKIWLDVQFSELCKIHNNFSINHLTDRLPCRDIVTINFVDF
jgi:hypothetical protein